MTEKFVHFACCKTLVDIKKLKVVKNYFDVTTDKCDSESHIALSTYMYVFQDSECAFSIL